MGILLAVGWEERAKEKKWPDTAKRQARASRMQCIEKSAASCAQERMEKAGLSKAGSKRLRLVYPKLAKGAPRFQRTKQAELHGFFSRAAGFRQVRDILLEGHAFVPFKLAVQDVGGTNRRNMVRAGSANAVARRRQRSDS